MEMQNAYQQKRAAQLKEWGAQIDLWEAKLETTSADLKIKRAEQIQALRAQQRSAAEKMHEMGKTSGEAWSQMKITADKIWDDLKSGVADARSKFK
jgi:recombinational DNA repair ATPase RecF